LIEFNAENRIQGLHKNEKLNAIGQEQASKLGKALRNVPIDGVFSSAMTRAVETAAYIYEHHPQAKLGQIKGLEEMDYGILEGQLIGDNIQFIQEMISQKWLKGDLNEAWPSGESPREVEERSTTALREFLIKESFQHLAVVCHSSINRVLLASLGHLNLMAFEHIDQGNTCINIIDYDPVLRNFTIRISNYTDHLSV